MENRISRGLKIIQKSTPLTNCLGNNGAFRHNFGHLDFIEVERGIKYLLNKNLDWTEEYFTAVGFPKVFYLKYHGYAHYFPLLTIFKSQKFIIKNFPQPVYGVLNQKKIGVVVGLERERGSIIKK